MNTFIEVLKHDFRNISWKNVAAIVLNVSSSIGIVLTNKIVYNKYGFAFATTLTLIHFICTALGLYFVARMKIFDITSIPILKILPLSLSFCGFVVFTNLSLQYNSVGFYQVFKVLTTPVIIAIEFIIYKKKTTDRILISLGVICFGVILTTVNDVSANLHGTFYAVIGVIVTSFYQIWVGTKQKELAVNSMQLLLYQAPLSALLLVPIIPIFDDTRLLGSFSMSMPALGAILMSGVLAFAVNLSIFLLIGRTSPISYNVVGHFKLTFIVISGYLFFNEQINGKSFFGIVLTLVGVFWYTHLKLQVQTPPPPSKFIEMEEERETIADLPTVNPTEQKDESGL